MIKYSVNFDRARMKVVVSGILTFKDRASHI